MTCKKYHHLKRQIFTNTTKMRTFTLFILLSGFMLAMGQNISPAKEGTYAFMLKDQENAPGISAVLKGNPEYVEAAIQEKFKAATKAEPQKVKKAKNLYEYESVVFPEISDAKLNYYYKIEPVSGSSEQAEVVLFLSPGNNNFWTSEKYDQEISNAKKMLNNMDGEVKLAEMKAKVAAQTALIKTMESKDSKIAKEEAKLKREHDKLMKALEKNEDAMEKILASQQEKAGELAEQKTKLADMEKEMASIKNL